MNQKLSKILYLLLIFSFIIFSLFYMWGLLTAGGVDVKVAASTADHRRHLYQISWTVTGLVLIIATLVIRSKQTAILRYSFPIMLAISAIFYIISISTFVATGFFAV